MANAVFKLTEAHFCGLPSQSNIYGLTSLSTRGVNKVLVASLKRKVFCVEYPKNYIPSTPEIQFTYIPGGAEIISIDAFNRSNHSHDFVVGITFIKKNDSQSSHYFNIYSGWEPDSEFDLDNIAQGCLSIELEFTPTQLYHAQIITEDGKEVVWLLCGGDSTIHLYREDKTQHCFREEPEKSAEFFPELQQLPSIALWMDILYLSETKRLTAVGCEDGYLRVSLVQRDSEGTNMIAKWETEHDGPICCARFFMDYDQAWFPPTMKTEFQDVFHDYKGDDPVHLVVVNTLEACVVFRDVVRNGLGSTFILPDSNRPDCNTTACIADVDMDGYNEILIGNYGQELLVYKLDEERNAYKLIWERAFSHPLLALAYVDITGDGLKELLVLSTKGLHILQHDLQDILFLCKTRMEELV